MCSGTVRTPDGWNDVSRAKVVEELREEHLRFCSETEITRSFVFVFVLLPAVGLLLLWTGFLWLGQAGATP